jgi:chromosome segregation ATPase
MSNEQYRREDDRRLRERIESLEARVVSLTSSQASNQSDIDDLALEIADHNQLLHGDKAERDSGIIGQINAIETKLNAVLAILHSDSLGHGGLLHEHKELHRKVFGKEKDIQHWLMFWAKVIAVLGSLAAVAISSWPSLSAYWKETRKDMIVLEKQMNKVKHPRVKKYVPKVVIEEHPDEPKPE